MLSINRVIQSMINFTDWESDGLIDGVVDLNGLNILMLISSLNCSIEKSVFHVDENLLDYTNLISGALSSKS